MSFGEHIGRIKEWLFQKKGIYYIGIALLTGYIVFLDQNSFLRSSQLASQINQLKKEIEAERKKLELSEDQLNELLKNDTALEKFARERYLMKQADEDLFLLPKE